MRKKTSQIIWIGLVLFLASASQSYAAESKPQPSVINVSASATQSVKPDQAVISIGVLNEAPKAQDAADQNNKQTSAVIDEIKKVLGGKGKVETMSYQLSPIIDYREGKQRTITRYSASNTVLVTLDDLDRVGKAIDAATRSGANNIQGLSFTLKDDAAIRQKALKDAVAKARQKADAIAAAAGVKIVRVMTIDENAGGFHPVPMMRKAAFAQSMAADAGMPAPVESGDLDITASVNMSFEVSQ